MSSQTVTRPDYTPEVIETCLRVMALCGGNSDEARRRLVAGGQLERVPSARALRKWRDTQHTERYLQVADELGPEIERTAVALTRANLVAIAGKVNDGIEGISFDRMSSSEAARAVQQLSIAQGVQQDKLMTLTNRPQSITEHRDLDEVLRGLNSVAPGAVGYDAQSTADEIPSEPTKMALMPDSAESNARDLAA